VALLAATLLVPQSCQAYSLYSNNRNSNNNNNIADIAAKTLSQKSIVRDTMFNSRSSTTINENTIRMMPAGQTPMVPYKVRKSKVGFAAVRVRQGAAQKSPLFIYSYNFVYLSLSIRTLFEKIIIGPKLGFCTVYRYQCRHVSRSDRYDFTLH
jgi:hypothetical protein